MTEEVPGAGLGSQQPGDTAAADGAAGPLSEHNEKPVNQHTLISTASEHACQVMVPASKRHGSCEKRLLCGRPVHYRSAAPQEVLTRMNEEADVTRTKHLGGEIWELCWFQDRRGDAWDLSLHPSSHIMSFFTGPKGGGNTEGSCGVAAAAVWVLSSCPSAPTPSSLTLTGWQDGGRRSVTGLGNEPGEQPVGEADGEDVAERERGGEEEEEEEEEEGSSDAPVALRIQMAFIFRASGGV
ncbi:unnamed protein product [Pleuronectes platessa]|uniref:Uncharacterized protein n=1 Tax=Pleuronectes platessa TaxID=8262 RepID=A0A9N7ZEW9_PLEPL|nr:unnamed protein product [Pleuronectes platessa]